MSDTDTKARANELYEADFYAWTQEQAKLLRERRWNDLDLENLVDEVEGVGSSEKREIRNRLVVLMAHLLKWKFQPGRRGSSWTDTIFEQRGQLADILESSPSLRSFFKKQIGSRYVGGRLKASKDTGIAVRLFPEECPFTAEQLLDPEFWPENPADE